MTRRPPGLAIPVVTGDAGAGVLARSGNPNIRLTMLYRAYCHLCDEMRDALLPIAAAGGVTLEFIDVDDAANAALEAAWGDKVPALFTGEPSAGTLVCHYRLDRARIEFVLSAARPKNG